MLTQGWVEKIKKMYNVKITYDCGTDVLDAVLSIDFNHTNAPCGRDLEIIRQENEQISQKLNKLGLVPSESYALSFGGFHHTGVASWCVRISHPNYHSMLPHVHSGITYFDIKNLLKDLNKRILQRAKPKNNNFSQRIYQN